MLPQIPNRWCETLPYALHCTGGLEVNPGFRPTTPRAILRGNLIRYIAHMRLDLYTVIHITYEPKRLIVALNFLSVVLASSRFFRACLHGLAFVAFVGGSGFSLALRVSPPGGSLPFAFVPRRRSSPGGVRFRRWLGLFLCLVGGPFLGAPLAFSLFLGRFSFASLAGLVVPAGPLPPLLFLA